MRQHQHEYRRSAEGQAYRSKRWRSDAFKGNAAASWAARRARQRNATGDSVATRRAFAELSREAKRLGLVIDHRVPLAPCRVCGKRGKHEPRNFALLPYALNASKGNRCMSCWMADLGRPIIVWLPDRGATNPHNPLEKSA
jgi:hypothetical protein